MVADSKQKDKEKDAPRQGGDDAWSKPAAAEFTSHLPNDTTDVFVVDVEKALASPAVRRAVLDTPGGFTEAGFQKTFGFGLDGLKKVVLGVDRARKAFFAVVRTAQPVRRDELVRNLGLKLQLTGKPYYLMTARLDSLSTLLLHGGEPIRGPMGLLPLDQQTFVVADLAPLKKYVEEEPKKLTPEPRQASSGAPGAPRPGGGGSGGPRPAPITNQNAPRQGGGGDSGVIGGAGGKFPRPGGGAGAPPAEESRDTGRSFLTVDPKLKDVLDRMTRAPEPPFLAWAGPPPEGVTLPFDLKALVGDYEKMTRPALNLRREINRMGLGLSEFDEGKAVALAVLTTQNDSTAGLLRRALDDGFAQALAAVDKNHGLKLRPPAAAGAAARPGGATPPRPVTGVATSAAGGDTADGAVRVDGRDNHLVVTAEVQLKRNWYDALVGVAGDTAVRLKGQADLADTRARVHDLARALKAYVEKNHQFPRGALARDLSAGRGLDWYPYQRVSWMAELLPHLGDGEFQDLKPNPAKSCDEEENLRLAQVTVPQFLVRANAAVPAYVSYGGKPQTFAATHFVGVAGVGLDAATYPADNAAVAKQLGVFGYDRAAKPEDIKDGQENTIAVLEIPSEHGTPWMAAGGGTVRGVADDDSALAPFVSTTYQGKPGTFAIMADFRVRFLPADLDPKVFRALCTINGGEKVQKLDELAPVVPEDGQPDKTELKAEEVAAGGGGPGAGKAPDAKKKEAEGGGLGWRPYVSKEGRYEVYFPGVAPVQEGTRPRPTPAGGLTDIVAAVAVPDGTRFEVSYADYPATVQGGDQNVVYNGALLAINGGKDLRVTRQSFAGAPGRAITLDSASLKGEIRMALVGNRLYVVSAVREGGAAPSTADVQTFMNSFRLAGTPAAGAAPVPGAPPQQQGAIRKGQGAVGGAGAGGETRPD
jgi:hypothetical protein